LDSGIFYGRILRTTWIYESEKAFFRYFVNRNLPLIEFWVIFETALEEQWQKQLREDNASLHNIPILETCRSIESHGRYVYTHDIFVEFQRQVIAATNYCDVKTILQNGEVRTIGIISKNWQGFD